jgi:hypothetical protein
MATALITEAQGRMKYGMPVMHPDSTQSVTYTTTTQSTAFSTSTNLIRVIADADVYLAFGDNPTATASDIRVPANTAEYFGVNPGDKVACYDGTS